MSLRRPDVQRIGDDFLFSYGVGGISIEMSGITESRREGVHAWVTVRSNAGKHAWTRLKLDSARERGTLAKDLATAVPSFKDYWVDALAQCAEMTYELNREGEPTVRLWDVPAPPETQYLVDALLPLNETTIMYGDAASGKSTVALRIALGVASGAPLAGVTVKQPGSVLYLDWESNSETHARRLRRLARGAGIENPPPIHYRWMKHPIADQVPALHREISRLGVKLLIVDSMGQACGDDINEAAVVIRAMNALRNLGVTRLAIHHMTHDAVRNGSTKAPQGSRYFRNYARAQWRLHRSPVDPNLARVLLWNEKVNDDAEWERPLSYEVAYDGRSGPISFAPFDPKTDPDLRQAFPLGDLLKDCLKRGAKTTSELASLTGARVDSVSRALRRSARFTQLEPRQGQDGGALWGLAESLLSES